MSYVCYTKGMNKRGGVSTLNKLDNLRPVVITMLINEGRLDDSDSAVCELCLEWATPYEIHHTKYDGATYYDLLVVCRSCNRLEENSYLA